MGVEEMTGINHLMQGYKNISTTSTTIIIIKQESGIDLNKTEGNLRSSAYLLVLIITKFCEGRKGPPRLSVLFSAQREAPTRRAFQTFGSGLRMKGAGGKVIS